MSKIQQIFASLEGDRLERVMQFLCFFMVLAVYGFRVPVFVMDIDKETAFGYNFKKVCNHIPCFLIR